MLIEMSFAPDDPFRRENEALKLTMTHRRILKSSLPKGFELGKDEYIYCRHYTREWFEFFDGFLSDVSADLNDMMIDEFQSVIKNGS